MKFKLENKIKKYRRLLNLTAKELGKGVISEDSIYNIENNKGKSSVSSLAIIINTINEYSRKCGIDLKLSLKDVLLSEEELLEEYCRGKLNEFAKKEFQEERYDELLQFCYKYEYPKVQGVIKFETACALRDENPEKSSTYFEEIYEIFDDKSKLLFNRARVEAKLKNFDRGLVLLKRAEKTCDDDELMENIKCNIGTYSSILSNFEYAKEVFEELLFRGISNYETKLIVKTNYAISLTFLKNYDKAIEIYEELLSIADDKSGIYYNLSGLYNIMGNYEESDKYLNILIEYELKKESLLMPSALHNLGKRYKDRGMIQAALSVYENAIKSGKKHKDYSKVLKTYLEILYTLKSVEKKDEFEEYFNSILKDIGIYTSKEENKSLLMKILIEFLNENKSEVVSKIVEKL